MRFALPPRLATPAALLGVSLCLFGFGFLAGLTTNAPWGTGPAAVCALGALLAAIPPLRWLRRRGGETATGDGPAWLARIDSPRAYGIAVALALAAAALLLLSRTWTGAALFWPACFGLMSAGFTAFGDARARALADLDEDDEEGSGVEGDADPDGTGHPDAVPVPT